MRDWEALAREELGRRGLLCDDGLAAELGAFLEDAWREAIDEGAGPEQAAELTLTRAGDWSRLARGLRRPEEDHMERFKRLWLPALVNAALAFAVLRAAVAAGLEPFVRLRGAGALVVYWPWLPVLALLAGATAWWSARRGARAGEQVLVGVSPSVVMLALLVFALVAGTVVEASVRIAFPAAGGVPMSVRLEAVVGMLGSWVLVPGALSLLGALPVVLSGHDRRQPGVA
jgi:hypothetical protein